MVYITGDLHGDLSRFKSKEFKKLKRKDTLIVCGDFGFIWDGSKKEEKAVKWLGRRKYNILFIEGAHDNLEIIESYPIINWNGGKAREISGKLKHLCRGSVFEIEDKTLFVFGGGEGADKSADNLKSWHKRQLPTELEIEKAWVNLAKIDYKPDFIITHKSSWKIKQLLTLEGSRPSVLEVFLDKVREKCDYTGWFFGNYHLDKIIPPNEMAIFRRVAPLLDYFPLDSRITSI